MDNYINTNQQNDQKAVRRGEMLLESWIKDKTLINADSLAFAWKIKTQEVENMQENGSLFALHIEGQNYYPQLMTNLPIEDAIKINKAFDISVDPSTKVIFLMRKHGSLGGKTVVQAANEQMESIIDIARSWHEG